MKFQGIPAHLTNCFTALCTLVIMAYSPAAAQETTFQTAPVNPDFIHFMKNDRTYPNRILSETNNPLGYIPSPIDMSHLRNLPANQSLLSPTQSLPPTYDLRNTGRISPVKDQGDCSSCWAFASMAILESALLPSELWNFSENNLKNTHGFDKSPCAGGNFTIAGAYFARWSGPVTESEDPYNAYNGYSPSGLSPSKHIQEMIIIGSRADYTDNNAIKQAIQSYGAIGTSMYWNSASYHSSYHSYNSSYSCNNPDRSICPCYPLMCNNHAVAIVGWDDNYSRYNFSSPPAGDGAFIIKNSWGSSWGDNGYFYLSYYDKNAFSDNVAFVSVQSANNFGRIYQYDPLGWIGNMGCSNSNTSFFANIFTAETDEQIVAVSFYTPAFNSVYSVWLYKDVYSGPTSGSMVTSKGGTIASPGYHTVILPQAVSVVKGQKFSVVMQLITPGYYYPIPVEKPLSGLSSRATANTGESFVSCNGTNWSDLHLSFPNRNVCLKAFAAAPDALPVMIIDKASYFSTIQAAYNSSSSNQSILLLDRAFQESVLFWNDIPIYINGGYGSSFLQQIGFSTISGSFTIKGGSVTVDRIIIK